MTTATLHEAGAPPHNWRILSHSADYALRAVLYLAARDHEGLVPANEIAEELKVPQRYLGKVLNTLAHAGTLQSTRGPRGGFRLTRPADELTLAEVIAPFDAIGQPLQCLLHHRTCSEPEPCAAHYEWQNVGAGMREFFNRMTVGGLLRSNGHAH
ncbi:MAG TPA: Rrf2 family transcriptional regulator [Longimicrobiales bacterium]|nr:Rrf2 family transcriptional regulator [Longimicrobiales bacterium]